MKYGKAITATLMTIGLAAAVTTTSAAGRTQQQPRLDLSIAAQPGAVGVASMGDSLSTLFGRRVKQTLREFLENFGGITPVADQGNALQRRDRRNRGDYDAGGPATDPIYTGSGPIGPDTE